MDRMQASHLVAVPPFVSDADRWEAVSRRDKSADGAFF